MTRRALGVWSFLLISLGLIWWFILPPNLGGRTTLFVTQGVSMEPSIQDGDLAVLHRADDYEVGDVIAYKARSINAVSLHRIIDVDSQGRFTTQGDNNPEPDLDHPTSADVYGRMDHLVEGGGGAVKLLTSMPVRVVGIGLIIWSLYGAFAATRRRDDELVTQVRAGTDSRSAPAFADRLAGIPKLSFDAVTGGADAGAPPGNPITFGLRVLAAALILLSAMLLATTMTRPAASSSEQKIMYTMKGKFNYSALAAPGGELIYKDRQVSTGEPVYFSLVDKLFVTYAFDFSTLGNFQGTKTFTLDTVLKGSSGWSHIVSSTQAVTFDGREYRAGTTLDLKHLRNLSKEVQALTKVGEGGYTVSVMPTVRLDGAMGEQKLTDEFPVALTFTADSNIMKVQQQTTNPGVAEPGSDENAPPVLEGLTPSKTGDVSIPPGTANEVTAAGRSVEITSLRLIGAAGVAFGLLLLLLASALRGRFRPEVEDISEEVLSQYGHMFQTAQTKQARAETSPEGRFGIRGPDGPKAPTKKDRLR